MVRQLEQPLTEQATVVDAEVAETTDAITGLLFLDAAVADHRMPFRQAVEVAHCSQTRPIGTGMLDVA